MEASDGVKGLPPLAVVFSGGAALGAFEGGVVDSLARSGVRPSLLVGTSIGALNAAFWAFHSDPDVGTAITANWRTAASAHIFPRWPTSIVLRLVEDRPIATPAHLFQFLRSTFGEELAIEDAAIPLAIVAVDIVSGAPVVLRKGPLIPALMASAAIPGIYPPVQIDDRLLADGGVVANADLEAVVEAGIEDAVLVDLIHPSDGDQLNGTRAMIEQAITIAMARQTELEIRLFEDRVRLAVIRLHLPYQPEPWDFASVDDLLALGRQSADRLLTAHVRAGRISPGVIEAAAVRNPTGRDVASVPRDARASVWSLGRGRRS